VFHASLLTPYIETGNHGPNFSRPPPDITIGENEYEVETIRNHRYFGKQKKLQYLLKWKGYPESDNTWEPATQVHAPQLVKQYHARRPATAIKTLLSQPERNHHPSSWRLPLVLCPQPQTTNLPPSSHSTGDDHSLTLRPESSSRACSDDTRSPLTPLRNSVCTNGPTPRTRTLYRPPSHAQSATVDSTTDTS
jgi:hypothetical protein